MTLKHPEGKLRQWLIPFDRDFIAAWQSEKHTICEDPLLGSVDGHYFFLEYDAIDAEKVVSDPTYLIAELQNCCVPKRTPENTKNYLSSLRKQDAL